eukprot:1154515-Pelagomonas_calceolata.AAC.3
MQTLQAAWGLRTMAEHSGLALKPWRSRSGACPAVEQSGSAWSAAAAAKVHLLGLHEATQDQGSA